MALLSGSMIPGRSREVVGLGCAPGSRVELAAKATASLRRLQTIVPVDRNECSWVHRSLEQWPATAQNTPAMVSPT